VSGQNFLKHVSVTATFIPPNFWTICLNYLHSPCKWRQYVPPEHSGHTFTTHFKLLQEKYNLFWQLILMHSGFSCWVPYD
jgi:hypothetical protein